LHTLPLQTCIETISNSATKCNLNILTSLNLISDLLFSLFSFQCMKQRQQHLYSSVQCSSFRRTFLIPFLNLSTDFLNAKPGRTFCISLRTYKEDIRDFTQVIIEYFAHEAITIRNFCQKWQQATSYPGLMCLVALVSPEIINLVPRAYVLGRSHKPWDNPWR
jgi:hypothetical protein